MRSLVQEFEFISPMGGTLIWVPGDTVQDNLRGLSEEAEQKLNTELAQIFNSFTMTLSGFMAEDPDDRSSLLGLYQEVFRSFIIRVARDALVALADSEQDTDDSSEAGE